MEVGIRRQKGETLLDKQNHLFLAVYIIDLVLHILYSALLDGDLNLMQKNKSERSFWKQMYGTGNRGEVVQPLPNVAKTTDNGVQ